MLIWRRPHAILRIYFLFIQIADANPLLVPLVWWIDSLEKGPRNKIMIFIVANFSSLLLGLFWETSLSIKHRFKGLWEGDALPSEPEVSIVSDNKAHPGAHEIYLGLDSAWEIEDIFIGSALFERIFGFFICSKVLPDDSLFESIIQQIKIVVMSCRVEQNQRMGIILGHLHNIVDLSRIVYVVNSLYLFYVGFFEERAMEPKNTIGSFQKGLALKVYRLTSFVLYLRSATLIVRGLAFELRLFV